MKTLFGVFVVVALLGATGTKVAAQFNQEEVAIVQSLFGMEKRSIYNKIMKLSAADSVGFWPLYDKYESKRKDLAKENVKLLQKFVSKFPNITHDEIHCMVEDIDDVNSDLRELIYDYYKDIRKATSTQTAAMFYQMESYILNAINIDVIQMLPFVGEFNVFKKQK